MRSPSSCCTALLISALVFQTTVARAQSPDPTSAQLAPAVQDTQQAGLPGAAPSAVAPSVAAPVPPERTAPAAPAASSTVSVRLRDGSVLTGERIPSEYVLVLKDQAQGTLRAIPIGDIASLDAGLIAPGALRVPSTVGRVNVALLSEPEGLAFSAQLRGSLSQRLCTAPCETKLDPGTYLFTAADEHGPQARRVLRVDDGDTVVAKVDRRAGLRLGGVVLLVLGAATSGAILAQREDENGDVSAPRVTGAITLLVASAIASITMLCVPSVRKIEALRARL